MINNIYFMNLCKRVWCRWDSAFVAVVFTGLKSGVTKQNRAYGSARKKIFQPFFTTKAIGHGTGLGLSLSYDIIKAHGGEIKVETKEGEGTEFIILLPVV
ncbi:MAG: ATP-binding protein [Ginsengibacter sp.]